MTQTKLTILVFFLITFISLPCLANQACGEFPKQAQIIATAETDSQPMCVVNIKYERGTTDSHPFCSFGHALPTTFMVPSINGKCPKRGDSLSGVLRENLKKELILDGGWYPAQKKAPPPQDPKVTTSFKKNVHEITHSEGTPAAKEPAAKAAE